MYIKVSGSVTTYPYTLQQLKSDNVNVSFPKVISNEILNNFYTYKVIPVGLDDSDYTKNYEEDTPIQSGSVYIQNWLITSASVEEITERENIQWDEVRSERNRL